MLVAFPLTASEQSTTNLQHLLNSIQLKDPYKTDALFSGISTGSLSPQVVDRYSPNAAFFLAVHALKQKHYESAERLLLHAAGKESSEVRAHATEEYLELLSTQEKWEQLIRYFDVNLKIVFEKSLEEGTTKSSNGLTEGQENPGVLYDMPRILLLYLQALYESGRTRTLSIAIETYRSLFTVSGSYRFALNRVVPGNEQQAQFLYLQIAHERSANQSIWRQHLLELISRYTRAQLPVDLYTAGGLLSLLELRFDAFSHVQQNLLKAKSAYGQHDYHTAFAYYLDFIQLVSDRLQNQERVPVEVLGLLSRVVSDEFALSGLYSGRTWEAYTAAEKVRRQIETVYEEHNAGADETLLPQIRTALFWMLETEGYLGRKLGRFSVARDLYTRALQISPYAERQRILWYIFDCTFRSNTAEAVAMLPEAAAEWSDPGYYTDVVYNLIDRLISRRQWEQVARIADVLEQKAVGVAGARASYISARAAESGYIEADRRKIVRWLRTAVRSSWGTGAGLYYRFMAASALEGYGISVDVMQPVDFCKILPTYTTDEATDELNTGDSKDMANVDNLIAKKGYGATRTWDWRSSSERTMNLSESQEDALIRGYVKFGLAAEAYRRYGNDRGYVRQLPLSTVREWTLALQGCQMYIESIRMFGRYCRDTRADMSYEDVQLLYPAAYSHFIDPLTEEYGLQPHIFYALVREESLFDADISSAAGAVGLSQLMPSTARDVAGRIGVQISDLTDPQLNLRLGSWYLEHLIGRTENLSQALFAYNGGITRVRRWVRQSDGAAGDVVLELIPFQETSHYGRKVLVSSVLYGYFYQGIDPHRLIKTFFR